MCPMTSLLPQSQHTLLTTYAELTTAQWILSFLTEFPGNTITHLLAWRFPLAGRLLCHLRSAPRSVSRSVGYNILLRTYKILLRTSDTCSARTIFQYCYWNTLVAECIWTNTGLLRLQLGEASCDSLFGLWISYLTLAHKEHNTRDNVVTVFVVCFFS